MNVKEKKEHYLNQVYGIVHDLGKGEYKFTDHEDSKIKIAEIKHFHGGSLNGEKSNVGILFFNYKGEQLPVRQLIPRDLERVYKKLSSRLTLGGDDE